MKSIERVALKGFMGSAWHLILDTGPRVFAFAERWGADEAYDLRAGFVELRAWKAGKSITALGERLELGVNRIAMWLGYGDGEVSGMVAWPEMPH